MEDKDKKVEKDDLRYLQDSYKDRPFLKFIKSEGWIFFVALIVVLSFVVYKRYFHRIEKITGENIPKYVRVLNDFNSLIEDFENEIKLRREEKKNNEKVRIDITAYKTRLYQIYDFMYVQKIAPESPFYKDYSKEEKGVINGLINVGKRLDKIVIEIYNFNGDPFTFTDFDTIKKLLSDIRLDINRFSGQR